MSRPNVETFSGSHQSSMGSGSPYLPFISKLTFVVCPAFTSTSLSCLPSVSCQTSIFCLPAGTFSSLATPLVSVTAAMPGTTASQPSIHEWTSHVSLIISGFSKVASCPHFSVSLLTFSFSTWGAPLYFTSTSTVPPPWAPASRGPTANITALPTSAIAVSATNVLRMDRPPAWLELRGSSSLSLSSLLDGAAPRRAHDQPQHSEREKSDSGRNEEPAVRLRLLQPQIVPRGQRHLGAALPRAALPRLERDGREHARTEARPLGAGGRERTLHHERVLAILEHRLTRRFAAGYGRQLRRTVRAQLADALALLPAQQIDAVGGITHQKVRTLRSRRLLRGELQRDRVGKRRLAVALRLARIVPGEMERDFLVVVDGAHTHQVDGGVEVPRIDDDLALEQDVVRRDLLPEVGGRIVGNRVLHRAHRHERGRLRRVRPERHDVVGQVPDELELLRRLLEGLRGERLDVGHHVASIPLG